MVVPRLVLFCFGCLTFALSAGASCYADLGDWTRPSAYSEFTTVSSAAALEASLAAGVDRNLYLSPGSYRLNNPIIISRSIPLVIHGASEFGVVLEAADPTKPLFTIQRATLVQFANLRLRPDSTGISAPVAVRIETFSPSTVEMLSVAIDKSRIEDVGNGSLLLQGCSFQQNGVPNALIVDHLEADVSLVGGDITNASEETVGAITFDHYHVWQKHGRLRVYGVTVEATLGQADFRFESTSALGPHVLADVRSEGANGSLAFSSALAYVPPAARVDLVVKNAALSWGPSYGIGTAIRYSGTGTLWILGLTGWRVQKLVVGNTSAATLVVAGTLTFPDSGQIPANVGSLYAGDNLFAYRSFTGTGQPPWPGGVDTRSSSGDQTIPKTRMLAPGQLLQSYGSVPAPPKDVLPRAIARPVMNVTLAGFKNVKTDFGAVGNGVANDTSALQAALNWQCTHGKGATLLHLPAGTYRTTARLRFNGSTTPCHDLPSGPFIAGAGRDVTKIVRTSGTGGGVFRGDGIAYGVVQGIEFVAPPGATEPNVTVEWEGLPGQIASRENAFDDLRLRGGAAAWATGVETNAGQCSAAVVTRSEMINAGIGFAVGQFNAVNNLCLGCAFTSNDYAFGQASFNGAVQVGGTLHVYDSASIGTKIREFTDLQGQSDAIFGFRGYTTDAPAWAYDGVWQSGGSALLQFEQATITPRSGAAPAFDWGSAGGIVFLDSTVSRFSGNLNSSYNAGYFLSLYSNIADWSSTVLTGSHAQKDRVDVRP